MSILITLIVITFVADVFAKSNDKSTIINTYNYKLFLLQPYDSADNNAEEPSGQIIECIRNKIKRQLGKYKDISFSSNIGKNKSTTQPIDGTNDFDLIIRLSFKCIDPESILNAEFEIRNQKVTNYFDSLIIPIKFSHKTINIDCEKEIFDFIKVAYGLSKAIQIKETYKYENAINFLLTFQKEICNSKCLAAINDCLGNLYLLKATKICNFTIDYNETIQNAIKHYTFSINQNPTFSDPYFNIGYIYAVLDFDLIKAEKYFKNAFNLDSDNFLYNWNLALVYLESGKSGVAKDIIKKFIRKNKISKAEEENLKLLTMN